MVETLALLFTSLLPFERIPTIYDIRLSTVLLVVSLLLVVVAIFTHIKNDLTKLDWAIAVFLLSCVISITTTADLTRSLWFFCLLLLALVGYYIVGRSFIRSSEKIERVLISISIFVSLFGLLQFFLDYLGVNILNWSMPEYSPHVLGFPRVYSVSTEPLYFANFLLVPILLSIKRLLASERARLFNVVTLAIFLVTFYLTISRGATLALLVALLLITVIFVRANPRKVFLILGVAISSWFVAVAIIAGVSNITGVSTYFKQMGVINSPIQESTSNRIAHYRQAWSVFKAHPITGVGIGAYDSVSTLPRTEREGNRQIVNNQYLELLAETGLIGFVSFGLIIIIALYQLIISFNKDLFLIGALISLLAALLAQYLFFSTTALLPFWYSLGLIWGATTKLRINSTS
jgi:putative inorganic carbon (hco3(-)) transporter